MTAWVDSMNRRSFVRRLPYFFTQWQPFRKRDMILEMIKLRLDGSKVEIEPILRWEDDGGLVIDTVFLRSSQPHAYRRPEKIVDGMEQAVYEKPSDLFQLKLLRR